ncbi:hypothetical protein [Chryseobacterium sp. FH2]|uniref:hypothetical protein n=1 Tax=Chryseobacterium sp. FH2 TaxID=1674291 RepID=UPI00103E9ABC|nr:hypothetical protein [Chryseobacterium sp. FH2]
MENELKKLFSSVNATKSWKIAVMQRSPEKFKFGANTISLCCNTSEFNLLNTALHSMFVDPFSLKIGMLNELRETRNNARHPGLIMEKTDAEQYIGLMTQSLLT